MDRMLAGVSTRKFAGVGEPVGEEVEQAASVDVASRRCRRCSSSAPAPRSGS